MRNSATMLRHMQDATQVVEQASALSSAPSGSAVTLNNWTSYPAPVGSGQRSCSTMSLHGRTSIASMQDGLTNRGFFRDGQFIPADGSTPDGYGVGGNVYSFVQLNGLYSCVPARQRTIRPEDLAMLGKWSVACHLIDGAATLLRTALYRVEAVTNMRPRYQALLQEEIEKHAAKSMQPAVTPAPATAAAPSGPPAVLDNRAESAGEAMDTSTTTASVAPSTGIPSSVTSPDGVQPGGPITPETSDPSTAATQQQPVTPAAQLSVTSNVPVQANMGSPQVSVARLSLSTPPQSSDTLPSETSLSQSAGDRGSAEMQPSESASGNLSAVTSAALGQLPAATSAASVANTEPSAPVDDHSAGINEPKAPVDERRAAAGSVASAQCVAEDAPEAVRSTTGASTPVVAATSVATVGTDAAIVREAVSATLRAAARVAAAREAAAAARPAAVSTTAEAATATADAATAAAASTTAEAATATAVEAAAAATAAATTALSAATAEAATGTSAASNDEFPEEVDPAFLAALPEEMRAEVIQQFENSRQARQRALNISQAAAAASEGTLTQHSFVDQDSIAEFLAAVPSHIAEEVSQGPVCQ